MKFVLVLLACAVLPLASIADENELPTPPPPEPALSVQPLPDFRDDSYRENAVFGFRPFDLRSLPNYFKTSTAMGGSDPQSWVSGVLVIAALCCVALMTMHFTDCSRTARALVALTPAVAGSVATVIQLHSVIAGTGVQWIGPAAPYDYSILYTLYSAHLGFYGSEALIALLCIDEFLRLRHAAKRKVATPSGLTRRCS